MPIISTPLNKLAANRKLLLVMYVMHMVDHTSCQTIPLIKAPMEKLGKSFSLTYLMAIPDFPIDEAYLIGGWLASALWSVCPFISSI